MSKKRKKQVSKYIPMVSKPQIANNPFWLQAKWHMIMIFGLAFILYANTITHDYTQDDAIVIYDNMFSQQGVSGIPGILGNDTFYGFFKEAGKANLVSGGRYRPFTLVMFAIEWQLFGRTPAVGHFINILLYGFLGIMLYKLFEIMFLRKKDTDDLRILAFITCLLFVAHPIHTEAVANIKGRDEIMTFLGAIIALWAAFKHKYSSNVKWIVLVIVSFFVALMSKENAITFLAVVPLSFFLFTKDRIGGSLTRLWPFAVSTFVFLFIRFSILGMDFGGAPNELMNNPFLKIVNNQYVDFSTGEWFATIMFTLGKYVQLLTFPHPLSHDYYPRAIEIMQLSDWQVIVSLLGYIGATVIAFISWRKDRIISYSIFFYIITLSIVSNIVFPIGTNMSERFVFIPSLGFLLLLTYLFQKFLPSRKIFITVMLFIIGAYSIKTVTRNMVWKDDFTLFTTDVKNNSNSAKLLNAAGGALTTTASEMPDGPKKTKYLNEAITHLQKAVKIHPTYRNAYLLLGNANYYLKNFESSIAYFDQSLALDSDFKDALKNLPIVLRDGGRHMGQVENNFPMAEKWLKRSFELNPQDYETCRLLGITFGIQNKHEMAVNYFQKAIALRPDIAANYKSLGTAYMNMGDQEKAREALNKAVELDPAALGKIQK